ncbi:MAG TPA: DUF1579 domain-containing protein [Herpetosiphonaceae bacterium]|nr:DUF1579 domain-containing protein [Herpetosiphonaceae bacterium]
MTDDQRAQAVDAVLNSLVGRWEGVARTWFEGEDPVDESPIRGMFRRIGDSRFVLYEYQGAFQGSPLSGAAIYGYNQQSDSFEGAWADSFHMTTNIMVSSGAAGAAGIDVLGSYSVEGGPTWGWRTEIARDGADRLILTSYNRIPEVGEFRAIEIVYARVAG